MVTLFNSPNPEKDWVMLAQKGNEFEHRLTDVDVKPLTGILDRLKNIFTSDALKSAYETMFSTPLSGHVNLNLSNGMEMKTNLKLGEETSCDITLTLAPTATDEEKSQVTAFCDQLKAILEKPITETKKAELEVLEHLLEKVINNTDEELAELYSAELYDAYPQLKPLKKYELQGLKALLEQLRTSKLSKQEIDALAAKHPYLKTVLDRLMMDEMKELMAKFPHAQTSIDWNGSEHKGELKIALTGSASVKVELKLPEKLGSLSDDIPAFVRAMIPSAVSEMIPGIMPLADENFRFELNAMNQFAFEFESRQVVKLKSLELKGNAIVKFLGRLVGKTLKINLPQRIAGRIDSTTKEIVFDPHTSFKIKFRRLEKIGKFVDLEKISYDMDANKLKVSFKCFGMNLNAAIDLNTSSIDRKTFKIVSKHDENPAYSKNSKTILGPLPVSADPSRPSTYLEEIRKLIPAGFQPLFDIFLGANPDGNFDFNLQEKSVGATFNLPDNINCKAKLQFNEEATSPQDALLNPQLLAALQAKLKSAVDAKTLDIEEIISLISTLPYLSATLNWKGSEGKATIIITLPGGAIFTLELDAPTLVGTSVKEVPETMNKLLSHFKFDKQFAKMRPFLSLDFDISMNEVRLPTLENNSLGATFKLPDDVTCKATIQLPEEGDASEIFNLNKALFNALKSATGIKTYTIDEIMSVLRAIPHASATLNWKGSKGQATINMTLPGGAIFTLELTASKDHGVLEKVLKELKFEEQFTKMRPFLALDFEISMDKTGAQKPKNQALSATFKLADEVSCKTTLSLPQNVVALEAIKLNQKLLDTMSAKLQSKMGKDIDGIMSILLSIPHQTMNLNWMGSQGTAIVTMTLPGGAIFIIELTAPKLIGESVATMPPAIESILSRLLFKEMFTSLKPFLSSDFHMTWDGKTSQFNMKFHQQQQLHIKTIELPKTGIAVQLAKAIGNNSYYKLPEVLKGKIDFKDLSVEFDPPITFELKSGIVKKDLDLRKIGYDTEQSKLKVDFKFFGKHSLTVRTGKPETEKKQPESTGDISIDFEVGPVPAKKK